MVVNFTLTVFVFAVDLNERSFTLIAVVFLLSINVVEPRGAAL